MEKKFVYQSVWAKDGTEPTFENFLKWVGSLVQAAFKVVGVEVNAEIDTEYDCAIEIRCGRDPMYTIWLNPDDHYDPKVSLSSWAYSWGDYYEPPTWFDKDLSGGEDTVHVLKAPRIIVVDYVEDCLHCLLMEKTIDSADDMTIYSW